MWVVRFVGPFRIHSPLAHIAFSPPTSKSVIIIIVVVVAALIPIILIGVEEPTSRADPLIPLIPLDFVLSVDSVGWEPSC